MKKTLFSGFLLFIFTFYQSQENFTVFDEILFYDGYAATVTDPAPPAGIIR